MTSLPQVLVCGAGPAGLVAALGLSLNGIPIRIIDQSNEYQKGTRGAGLHPRSLELLSLLGVLPDICRTARTVPPYRQYDADGEHVVKTWQWSVAEPVTPSKPYPNPLLNSQADTCSVLRQHLAGHGVNVELGTAIKSFTQDASSVLATLSRTSPSGIETTEVIRVPYLIGTDGAKGLTRKLLGIGFAGESLPQAVIVGDAVLEGLDREHWHGFGDPVNGAFHTLPIGNGDMSNFIIAGSRIDFDRIIAEGPDGVRRSVADVTRNPNVKVLDVRWMSLFKPSFRCADLFGIGRVFIGGDNAHVHSPMGGQGLNTSIQDSHNLAWKMALVLKGQSPVSLLDSYNEERIPVVKCMLGITQNLHSDRVLGADETARNVNPATTRYGGTSGMKPGEQRSNLLKQLGVHYRWSPIVIDSRNDTLSQAEIEATKLTAYGIEDADPTDVRAGDRAPDAPVRLVDAEERAIQTTLHAVFSPTVHTALIFASARLSPDDGLLRKLLRGLDAFGSNVKSYIIFETAESRINDFKRGVGVLVDAERHAVTNYGIDNAEQPSVVIIRPDGVVGAFVSTAEGVSRYHDRVFGV